MVPALLLKDPDWGLLGSSAFEGRNPLEGDIPGTPPSTGVELELSDGQDLTPVHLVPHC